MRRYKCRIFGREIGAIGIFYEKETVEVRARNEEEAREVCFKDWGRSIEIRNIVVETVTQ